MKLVPLTLAAILATAFSGTVLADESDTVFIGNHTMISNDIDIYGGAHVKGWIHIGSESKAITNNFQYAVGNATYTGSDNNAGVAGGSGKGAPGHLGNHLSAGARKCPSKERGAT